MATWRDKLRSAAFKGAAFEVETHDSESGRRAEVHEYPNRDIPYVEDLGKRAETFTVEAFVIGDDYMDKRDALKDACTSYGAGTLTHPSLGDISAVCTSCRVSESSEYGRMARFTLTFQEAGEQASPTDSINYKDKVKSLSDSAQTDIIDSFLENFSLSGVDTFTSNSLGSTAASVAESLSNAMDFVNSQVTELTGLTDSVRGASSFITDIWDTAMDAVDIVTSVINTVSGIIDNPLNYLGTPAYFATSLSNALSVITAFLSPKDAIKQLQTATASETAATGSQNTARAQQEAQLTSQIKALSDRLSITEQAKALAGMEFTNSSDAQEALEDFIAQVETQLLLENVNTTDAVFSGLQNLKAAVVKDIQTAIKKLPEVTGLTLSQNTPSAVLAYDLYQDLDRAVEIVDRNKVRNPGFVPRGITLEVLAS